jgi:acetyl-CoA carboxylase carboxyltransferase component
MAEVRSPLQGVVVRVAAAVGDEVGTATPVVVIESMKMEHVVEAGDQGVVGRVAVATGDQVQPGDVLVVLDPAAAAVVEPAEPSSAPAADWAGGAGGSAGVSTTTPAGAAGGGAAPSGRVEPVPPPGGPRAAADRSDGGSGGGRLDPGGSGGGRLDPGGSGGGRLDPGGGSDGRGGGRADLAEVRERHRLTLDAARPEALARRHARGQRTARENVADLVDPGSFVEYGALAIAAQRRRWPVDELIARTPADGLVGGVGTIDGRPTAVLSYDYTVLAGTQGFQNHRKKDRLFEVIARRRLPAVLFAEGGGGRPGDTDAPGVSGLDCLAFQLWGGLSGLVPRVAIVAGRCFAGNAALAGCSDAVIGVRGANLGMGGPAMIEGGGLGTFAPEDIGPLDLQVATGVVDVAVDDEAEAVAVARRYLSYFGGPVAGWSAGDPAALRDLVPENRRRVYDVRTIVAALADDDSVLELRPEFGRGMVTALVRIEGRPLGVVANNPVHQAGAIDADGADKAARFLQLCDAFDLPVLFLCDTPGIMVGPEAEATGLVRHVSRLFVTGANLDVPFGTIILRKGYGLGAQTMAGGSFKAPLFCVAWPTGEVGGMGLEGAVRLGFRRELDAITDEDERQRAFDTMVEAAYQHGKALSSATHFEIDDVIDPADSRRWITTLLTSGGPPPSGGPDPSAGSGAPAEPAWRARPGRKRPFVDTW